MSSSSVPSAFKSWLTEKLRELNTDERVFGDYIIGILDSEESVEEKTEALEGILIAIIEDDIAEQINLILKKWKECQPKAEENTNKSSSVDVDEQLVKLLEAQKLQTTSQERQYTEEERRIREQILSQYSQTEVSDDGADESDDAVNKENSNSMTGIERNTNAQDMLKLQKERREQLRLDSAAKKQKDKEDREKQKQLREEKKEKRKTVKGERRR